MAAHPEHTILPLPSFERPVKLALVVAPYYRAIAEALVAGAMATAARAGAAVERFDVPGALEIPPAIALADRMGRFDGFVALGCIIRGETTHYDTVCNDSSRGLMLLGLGGRRSGTGSSRSRTWPRPRCAPIPRDRTRAAARPAAALHLVAMARAIGATRRGVGFNAHLGTPG